MKKSLLTLLCCIWAVSYVNGQKQSIKYKTVSLYEEQTFYLNGGLKASVNGNSRSHYKIELPANTVEWYYAVTVEKNKASNREAINLVAQLTKLIDKTGITSIVASHLLTPAGTGTCDVYLISSAYINAFHSKGEFYYDQDHSVLNYKSGVVKVIMKPDYLKRFYIGFRNPSTMEGVTIHFSAVAIVAEHILDISTATNSTAEAGDPKKWTREEKNGIYNRIEKGIKRFYSNNEIKNCTERDIKSMAACVTDAFTKNDKDIFLEMAEYEQEILLGDIISNCSQCTDLPVDIFAKAIKM